MAEPVSHDVVNQTRSGGEFSPSDVPASINDKTSAEGDVGRITINQLDEQDSPSTGEHKTAMDINESENFVGQGNGDVGRQGPNSVASRALELNGVASLSDGGEDSSLGGSDTDTSRNDGRHHARTGSMKKPTAFKPVSFAKFSVPKAPGSSTVPKPGDKRTIQSSSPEGTELTTIATTPVSSSSIASPQLATRPRLVAKTTSGLGSLSKPSASLKATSSGPDPSQVWNKNRPAQPPSTKHLTDEELKQQYGIHMTSRIQEDGKATEAKWADIDDDEEDWAPETIEWNDGTKINLTHAENDVPPQDTPQTHKAKEVAHHPEENVPREAPRTLLSKPSTTVGPNATVLRLGASAERQQQQAKAAIASRSGGDRPMLTVKSPAPPPSKSPWAALPPVERISPIHPPFQGAQGQHISRMPNREQAVPENAIHSIPTREIAADDFNRSWRDEQSNAPRELFNSHSGRYEPVPDNRKGSTRQEVHSRAPAVLQRPGGNDLAGPAEPSAAFQTHRSTHPEIGPWTRRRASSNVSGGSGSYGRRMSFGRPDGPGKTHDGRRGSQVNGTLEHPIQPNEAPHVKEPGLQDNQQPAASIPGQPGAPNNGAYAPPVSQPGAAQTQPEAPSQEVPQSSSEDLVIMQQRIMKEKRMEARQRRIEQEQKEEAARRERIRLKLEALGPAPEVKAKPEDQADSTSLPGTRPTVQSPPKPPVPEPTGEPKQYGMMKVHPPEPVKKIVPSIQERVVEKPSTVSAPPRRGVSPARDAKAEPVQPNGILPHGESFPKAHGQDVEDSTSDEKDSQWKGNINPNTYSPWTTAPKLSNHPSPSSNPWKPLSSDKTLGNGTFDRSLTNFSPRDLSLRTPIALAEPTSIVPLPGNMDKMSGPQPFTSTRLGKDGQPLSALPPSEKRHVSYEPFQAITRPRPIGPPNTHWASEPRRGATAAWNSFPAVAAKQDAEDNKRFQRELESMRDEPSASLDISELAETWRQVQPGEQAGKRQVVSVVKQTEAPAPLPSLPGFDASIDGLPFTETQPRPFSNVIGRGSRFFPTITDTPKGTVIVDDARPRSPSPPPPEEHSSHPAFSGNIYRPLVNLPIPKPVVRLPPKGKAAPSKPPTFASMAMAPPRPTRQVNVATSWQDRINGLLGKNAVPEKRNTLAVTSATREPLDVQSNPASAAVSLPHSLRQVTTMEPSVASKVVSKEVEEEEAIFEDREVGSLPIVHIPIMAPPNAWHAALPPPTRMRPKILKPMQVHSIEPYAFDPPEKDSSGNWQVRVHPAGSTNAKSVAFAKKPPGPASRQKAPSSFRTRKHPPRSRDVSAKSNTTQGSKRQTSSTHNSKHNGPPTRGT